MNEAVVIKKLMDHEERLDRIEGKIDGLLTREEYLQSQDKIIQILERLDQERVFTNQTIRNTEDALQEHDQRLHHHDVALQQLPTAV